MSAPATARIDAMPARVGCYEIVRKRRMASTLVGVRDMGTVDGTPQRGKCSRIQRKTARIFAAQS